MEQYVEAAYENVASGPLIIVTTNVSASGPHEPTTPVVSTNTKAGKVESLVPSVYTVLSVDADEKEPVPFKVDQVVEVDDAPLKVIEIALVQMVKSRPAFTVTAVPAVTVTSEFARQPEAS